MLARTTAGDQDFRARRRLITPHIQVENGRAQMMPDGLRLVRQSGLDPAGIGVLFILIANRQRNLVFDRGQAGDRRRQAALGQGFAQLPLDQRHEGLRPGAFRQPFGPGKVMERPVGGESDETAGRDVAAVRYGRLEPSPKGLDRGAFRGGFPIGVFVGETLYCQGRREGQAWSLPPALLPAHRLGPEHGVAQAAQHALEGQIVEYAQRHDAKQQRYSRQPLGNRLIPSGGFARRRPVTGQ